jgi:myo-inositol-1(or 4)-monophosphatase
MSADERQGTEERLRLAAELAVRGGRMLLAAFHRAQIAIGLDDPGTEAHAAVRDHLGAAIAAAFPDDALVEAEPGGRASRYSWVVAPIDGLEDFGRGLPGFAVTLGVLRDGRPFVGAVYDPVSRWLFSACTGRGAWLNDRPLRVRASGLSRASLIAVGNTCEAGVPPFTEEWLRRYRIRRTGSTALHLCYVAMGGLDLVHDHRATLREIAGAAAILMEAGGVVTREDSTCMFPAAPAELAGKPLSMLAGNPTSHREALADARATSPKIYGGVIVP